MKQKSQLKTDDPRFTRELDDQVTRLRRLLVLMAPETGSSALGAMRMAFPDTGLSERVQALKAYRR